MRTTADQLAAVLDHWQSGTGPLYQQLAGAIVSLAESGSLEYGTRLPSERSLAECLHLSRNTVTAAYQQLRDEEWLDVRPGAAPTLGSRSRGIEGLSPQDRFSRILNAGPGPIVGLSGACPPPAPVVMDALRNPGPDLDSMVLSGNGYASLGDPTLIDAIVGLLRRDGIPARPDEIVVTAGGQQAVWLAVTALAGPSSPVAVEAATYPGVFDAISASGSRTLGLPMGVNGLDVTASAKLLRAARPDVAYLSTFQNPTGTALEPEAALALLAAAEETGTTIIDDRIMADLPLDGVKRPPLAALRPNANIITIGGLSKVFWGGLRIGWLHTNPTLAAQLRHRKAAMDLGSPSFFQHLATRLITDHYDAVAAWRTEQLRVSLDATVRALAEFAPEWEYAMPAGGPSLWVKVPGVNEDRFADRAAAAGAPVAPGSAFEVLPGAGSGRFRLPYYLEPDQMELGVKILAAAA
ncbi:PLP-dependent aminotransferase family protein [Demequina sp.]|uniref:aminotransferase-like domain-containing protein n=1 Tax=Demequina sp. TaxID=2050685 RepID=UPI003D0B8955